MWQEEGSGEGVFKNHIFFSKFQKNVIIQKINKMGCGRGEGVWQGRRGGRAGFKNYKTKYFSKFQKIVIIQKKEEKKKRGCGRGEGV